MRATLALASSLLDRASVRFQKASKSAFRIVGGASRAILRWLTGRLVHRATGTRKISRGARILRGVLGGAYNEYPVR